MVIQDPHGSSVKPGSGGPAVTQLAVVRDPEKPVAGSVISHTLADRRLRLARTDADRAMYLGQRGVRGCTLPRVQPRINVCRFAKLQSGAPRRVANSNVARTCDPLVDISSTKALSGKSHKRRCLCLMAMAVSRKLYRVSNM